MEIRPFSVADIEQLGELDGTYIASSYLAVELEEGNNLNRSFRLVERELCPPEVHGEGYAYGEAEQEHVCRSLAEGEGLVLAVEAEDGKLVGILEVEPRNWNNTAIIWNIQLAPPARGRGIGRQLVAQAVAWAKERSYRALWLETQTSNVAACRFYQRCGFVLAGFDTMFYTNEDIERHGVALFFYLNLEQAAG